MKLLQLTSLAYLLMICKTDAESKCQSPQYIENGSTGIIQCSFPEDVHSLLWYNSTKFVPVNSILTLIDSVTSGKGFDSGEFDIYPNGSLIINNVSMKHEGTYSVIELATLTSRQTTYTISVLVIASTFDRMPVISKCINGSEICFEISDQTSSISCTIRDARPVIPLSLTVRTINGDRNISSHLLLTNETHPFVTSRVTTTNPFVYSAMLTLLVCKADGPPDLLERNESLLLLQNTDESLTGVKSNQIFSEKGSKLQLHCTDSHISYLTWQIKQSPDTVFKNILYAVFIGENFTYINDNDYILHANSSVVVDKVGVHHEGTYRCISGNGFEDELIIYEVVVFVFPDPAYLVVNGCDHQQYCVLDAHLEGSLTCSVKRIRPQVDLEFTKVFGQPSNVVHFYDKKITIKDNGDTSDVFLISKYRFNGAVHPRLTVECKIIGTNINELHLSTKFDLLLLQGVETTTQDNLSSGEHNYWIIAVVLVLVLVFIVACGLVMFKVSNKTCIIGRKKKNEQQRIPLEETERGTNFSYGDSNDGRREMPNRVDPEEVIPLISESDLRVKLKILQDGLKAVYKTFYKAIQPIPYIREKLYCVDDVFVESGIQLVKISGKKTQSRNTESDTTETENIQMKSYRNIFDDNVLSSKRIIVEGEPGYGKSTLTLQAAYDWCKAKSSSPLARFEVFILLKFRLLGGITSIYKAIKLFALPRDCTLTENDVKEILANCARVVIVLDGFDEYPDMNIDIDSDMMEIIKGKMFAEQKIVVCTRTGCLPTYIDPDTVHVRLTGFDDVARDQYIRLALGGVTNEFANEIKQDLDENPVMSDLCQVPLFFVMFSHMASDSKDILNCDSVTKFFTHMIRCFYNHMWNKNMEVTAHDRFPVETADKSALCKLAFEGLTDDKQTLVWEKKEFFDKVGKDCCEELIKIGILVEEELLNDLTDSSGLDHVPYRHVIRFYHKVFTEWYAAHHLGELAKKNYFFRNRRLGNILKRLDPQDVQFVFRFACGLNPITFTSIFTYLGGFNRNVASLCIFEAASKVDEIKSIVKKMCSEKMTFTNLESRLLQRSRIQLLNIASENQISISHVSLYNCYSTVYLSGGYHLQLKSNLNIPVLTTLNTLWIHESDRDISVAEFTDILQYSSKCLALKELMLLHCLLPQSVQAESVSILRSRNVKVIWFPQWPTYYQLNLQSCLWERTDGYHGPVIGVMTDDDYQSEVREFRRNYGGE